MNFHAFINSFREFLDIFDFLSILFINFCDDFERPMRLTEYFENLFSVVIDPILLFNFHAVIGSLCAFYMEVNLTVQFGTLYDSSLLRTFLTAYNTANIELWEVQFIHFDRCPWSNLRTWHPHWATVMNPMVESFSLRGILIFQLLLVPWQESWIVFRDTMVWLFVLVEIKLKIVLIF